METTLIVHGGQNQLRAIAMAELIAQSVIAGSEIPDVVVFSGGKTNRFSERSEAEQMRDIYEARLMRILPELNTIELPQIAFEEGSCDTWDNVEKMMKDKLIDVDDHIEVLSSASHYHDFGLYTRLYDFPPFGFMQQNIYFYHRDEKGILNM